MRTTRSILADNWHKAFIIWALCALGTLGSLAPARAQQVLLQTNVATDTLAPRTGPNRPWFGHTYVGYGLAAGRSALGVKYGFGSSETLVGGRLKRRLTGNLALCADLRYAFLRYQLDPDQAHPAPFLSDPEAHQHLSYHQIQSELSLRLNVGRRGNVVGRYADLLAYGGWAFSASNAAELPAPGGGQRELVEYAPPYLARWLGGVGLRLGSNSLALVGRYRLSNALRGPGLPEPPRVTVGLEIGWF